MIVNNDILQRQADTVAQQIGAVRSIQADPERLAQFAGDFAIRFCWSSNAIEGNTLSLDETEALVEFDEVRSGHTYTEYLEAKNLYQAIRTMMIPFRHTPITEEWIKKSNALIRGDSGNYRTKNVRIGTLLETAYTPPAFQSVPELMKTYLTTVNTFEESSLLAVVQQISVRHMDFERIHPFSDGNGRTGRMILNQQLINCGLLPVTITKNSAYMQAFRQYERNGDYSKMLHSILSAEAEAIDRLSALERPSVLAALREKQEAITAKPRTEGSPSKDDLEH